MIQSGGNATPQNHAGFSAAQRDPVAEPLRGVRLFEVVDTTTPARSRGGLTGVFKRNYQWTPGVNEATCLRALSLDDPDLMVVVDEDGVPQVMSHELLSPACDCGFWAYTDGDQELVVHGPLVFGVIEGWGRMVVGPAGFRAEKARILALAFVNPSTDPDIVKPLPRSELLISWLEGLFGSAGLPSFLRGVAEDQVEDPAWLYVSDELRGVIEARYGVPSFSSVRDMLREFPPTSTSPLVEGGDRDG